MVKRSKLGGTDFDFVTLKFPAGVIPAPHPAG